MQNLFQNESGLVFPGIDETNTRRIRQALIEELGLSRQQIAEAASYSMAMVARFALGLSANNASISVFATDSLAGEVALATTRHLVNAGATANIWILSDKITLSSSFNSQLITLNRMGLIENKIFISDINANHLNSINQILPSSHNVIFGALLDHAINTININSIIELLNESPTPVHVVDAPSGIDLNEGKPLSMPLYASSTLSLGTPYQGLAFGAEYVGRHYICDISLTAALYTSCGFDLTPLFAEQPVQKIFPKKEA